MMYLNTIKNVGDTFVSTCVYSKNIPIKLKVKSIHAIISDKENSSMIYFCLPVSSKFKNIPLIPFNKTMIKAAEKIEREKDNVDKVEKVIKYLCENYGISKAEMIGRDTARKYSYPRSILFYILNKRYYITSYFIAIQIGRVNHLGVPSHASVVQGANRVSDFMDVHGDVKEEVENLIEKIDKLYGFEGK